MTSSLLVGQLDFARFAYGLALVAIAMVCGLLDAQEREALPWPWLAGFAALHAVNEWLDLVPAAGGWAEAVRAAQLVLWVGSFVALAEFGRRGNRKPPSEWLYLVAAVAGVWGASAGVAGFKAALGYTLVLPGGLAAAVALGRRGATPLRAAAGAVATYAVLSGSFPPEAGFFPASILHREAFQAWMGLPIWFPRAAACAGAAGALWCHAHTFDGNRTDDRLTPPPPGWVLGTLVAVLVAGWGATEGLGRYAARDLARSARIEAVSFAARTADALAAERIRAKTLAALPRSRVALATAATVRPVRPAPLDLPAGPGGVLMLSTPDGFPVARTPTVHPEPSFPTTPAGADPGLWFGSTGDTSAGLCAGRPVLGFDHLLMGRATACRPLFLPEEAADPGLRILVTAPDGTETATGPPMHSEGRAPVARVATVAGTPWKIRVERSSIQVSNYRLFGIGGTLFAWVLTLGLYVQTERRWASALALAASERQFRRLLAASPDGIAVLGRSDGRVHWANNGLSRLTGVDADNLSGREATTLFSDTEGAHPPWSDLAHDLTHGSGTWHVRRTDGSDRVLEMAAAEAVLGGEACMVATLRDVTDREAAARRQADSEARYRAMMAAMDDRAYICSAEGVIEYANPALVRSLGEDPTGDRCHRALYALEHRCPQCLDVLDPGQRHRWEATNPRNGRVLSGVQTPLRWADGRLSRLTLMRDITERRQAEDALRAEKEFADQLVLSSAVAAFVIDTDHRVRVWNKACSELTGVPAHRMVGTRETWKGFYSFRRPTLADLVLDGESDASPEACDTITPSALNPQARHSEGWFPNLNGRDRYLSFDAAPIRDGEGRITAVIETLQDRTESKQSEARSSLLSTAVDQAAETILVTDDKGRIQYVNPAFEQVTGYKVVEVLGRPVSMLKSGAHDRSFYSELWTTIRGGDVWTGTFHNRKKDGTPFEEEASISPVTDAHGRTTHFVAVKRDVTHEAEMARQLRQAQKLDALGTLASGIAHDFNNILTSIIGYAEMTIDDVPTGSVAAGNLERILAGGERAQAMVRQILTFSREDDGEHEVVALGPVVEEVTDLLRAALPPNVTLTLRADAPDTRVRADATQVHQVLMNLGTNAAHALGIDGGTLEIVLARADFDEASAEIHPDLSAGAYLRVSVSDDGCGMDPGVASRVFDPFYTTKGVGEGTGLGLSVVHGIIQGHGGAIHLHTALGVGTTFHVFLPLAEGDGAPADVQGAPDGRLHVLVADDEVEVAELVQQVLVNLGYRVTLCTGGPEAIARFRHTPNDFDLIVTDQTMPGATGFDLVRAARATRPGIPVVLLTGFERQTTRDEALELDVNELLLKPLTVRELAAAVRRAVTPEDDPVLRATGGSS